MTIITTAPLTCLLPPEAGVEEVAAAVVAGVTLLTPQTITATRITTTTTATTTTTTAADTMTRTTEATRTFRLRRSGPEVAEGAREEEEEPPQPGGEEARGRPGAEEEGASPREAAVVLGVREQAEACGGPEEDRCSREAAAGYVVAGVAAVEV